MRIGCCGWWAAAHRTSRWAETGWCTLRDASGNGWADPLEASRTLRIRPAPGDERAGSRSSRDPARSSSRAADRVGGAQAAGAPGPSGIPRLHHSRKNRNHTTRIEIAKLHHELDAAQVRQAVEKADAWYESRAVATV